MEGDNKTKKNQVENQNNTISRRQFMKLASVFGVTAAFGGLLTACSSSGSSVSDNVKKQASIEGDKSGKADFKAVFSVDGVLNKYDGPVVKCSAFMIGLWELKQAIERNSNGKIFVDIQESAVLGSQAVAAQKMQQGALEMSHCSTQNMAGIIPPWNVLDIPYTIPTIEDFFKVVYSKEVNKTMRERSKQMGGILLTVTPQARWLEMNKKIKNDIRKPEDLKGLKIRVTGSQLEQLAFKILPCNPTPVAWGEVPTAMNEGAVDGIHVGPLSVADFGILGAVGQVVDTKFMYNSDATFVSTKWFSKLPANLQEAMLVSGLEAQKYISENYQKLEKEQIGLSPDSPTSSLYKKEGIKMTFLSKEERQVWMDYLSYERNKDKYEELINKFGSSEYEAIKEAVKNGSPNPQKWWV